MRVRKRLVGLVFFLICVMSSVVIVKAGFTITSIASTWARSNCGINMCNVALFTEWDYYDGDYVRVNKKQDIIDNNYVDNISLITFSPTGAVVKYQNLYNYGESSSSTEVSVEYYVSYNMRCIESGKLINYCDVWGETEEDIVLYYRYCLHD